MSHSKIVMWSVLLTMAAGCDSAYYKTMETFGVHKRDILVDKVEDARDAQTEAKEQFVSALEEFSSVVNFQGGDLEQKYKTLQSEYDRSKSRADAVHERISEVKRVSEALFEEWEEELDQYSNENLRRTSEQTMRQTQQKYNQMITAMERAATKIDPVLMAFGDQVLFLKHNLNARAVASLQDELTTVENEIAVLVKEMERSINEADAFIQEMTQTSAQ